MAVRRRSQGAKGLGWKAAGGVLSSSVGRPRPGGLDPERNLLRPGLVSHLRCCRRQFQHRRRTVERKTNRGQDYNVHLDGYNQLGAITGKGPSARHEIFYFTESTLAAVRINDYKYRFTDQPNGWFGGTVKVDWPTLVNLRLDPFERTGWSDGKINGSVYYYRWFVSQFWRFVFVQQEVAKEAQTFLDYPPMQAGASFNMSAIKAEMEKKMEDTKKSMSQ